MADTPQGGTVLLVEDDEVFRSRLARGFAGRGFATLEAGGIAAMNDVLASACPDYAVVDLRLGNDSGLDALRGLRRRCPSTVCVVLTGYGSIATALEAVAIGAAHYVTKPAGIDEILAGFARAGQAAPPAVPPLKTPSLARVEWEHINRVLADCDGNVSEAARRLGMHRRSLQRKLSKRPVRE